MLTKQEVIDRLVDEFNIWDDQAENMVEEHFSSVETKADSFDAAEAVIEAECKKLGVEHLPEEDYYSDTDDDDTDEFEDDEE